MNGDAVYWETARGQGSDGKPLLTARQLEALELYAGRGMSYATIALHLGISRERVKQLCERAAQKIDLQLRKAAAA